MARDDPTEPIFVDARLRPPPPRPRPRPTPPPEDTAWFDEGEPLPSRPPRPPKAARKPARARKPLPKPAPARSAAPAAEDLDRTMPVRAVGGPGPGPGAPRRRRRRPPPFLRPGAPGAIIMTGFLAVIVAFVATFAYAIVDASKPIQEPVEETTEATYVPPTTVAGQTSTTRPPEDLTEDEVADRVAGTVRGVQTRDVAGNPVTGTAFVVGSFGGQTLLLTSFEVVQASTRIPGPGISLDGNRQATLWTWEESRDLALLVTGGSIESLPWATVAPKPGDKVWVGGAGQKMSAGIVLTASDTAIEHNIFVDDVRRGAPLVNQRGELLGMTSLAFNPGGRGTDAMFSAVPIRAACERILKCGSGNTAPEPEGATSGTTTTTTTRRG